MGIRTRLLVWTVVLGFAGSMAAPLAAADGIATDHATVCVTINTGSCEVASPGMTHLAPGVFGKILLTGLFSGMARLSFTDSDGRWGVVWCEGTMVGSGLGTNTEPLVHCEYEGWPVRTGIPFTLRCESEGIGVAMCSVTV